MANLEMGQSIQKGMEILPVRRQRSVGRQVEGAPDPSVIKAAEFEV